MKSAIFTCFDAACPFARSVEMIREAGFDVVSLGARHADYTTRAGRAETQKILSANGMGIDSVHAPFPEGDRLFSLDETERLESLRQCHVAVDTAVELNGRIVVIHLIQPYGIPHGPVRDNMIDKGRSSVAALVAYADRRGVKLALENGQKRDYDLVLIDLLLEFQADHVGLCYDSGHENVQGTCFNLLEQFGHRLFTVHIHDNKGSDIHALPYEGTIDWDRFRTVFHGLEYDGNLLLEVHTDHSEFKDYASFLAQAAERAAKLRQPPQ